MIMVLICEKLRNKCHPRWSEFYGLSFIVVLVVVVVVVEAYVLIITTIDMINRGQIKRSFFLLIFNI